MVKFVKLRRQHLRREARKRRMSFVSEGGAKGPGEAGATKSIPALANAVMDAKGYQREALGNAVLEMPHMSAPEERSKINNSRPAYVVLSACFRKARRRAIGISLE